MDTLNVIKQKIVVIFPIATVQQIDDLASDIYGYLIANQGTQLVERYEDNDLSVITGAIQNKINNGFSVDSITHMTGTLLFSVIVKYTKL